MPKEAYTATALGKILGLSLRRIGQLADSGVFEKRNGKYGLDAVTAYVEYLRERASRSTSYTEKIDAEKARKLTRENDLAEGLVAPIEVLQDALAKLVGVWIPILDGFPLNLKRAWPELTGDQIMVAKQAVAELRNALADVELDF